MNVQYKDLLERAGWTLAQAATGIAITSLASVPAWWAIPIASGLSLLKTWIIQRSGAK